MLRARAAYRAVEVSRVVAVCSCLFPCEGRCRDRAG